MKKLPINATVKVRIYNYLCEKIEDSIAYGYRRAHKHTDKPTEVQVRTEIENSVMNTLCEIFAFEDENES